MIRYFDEIENPNNVTIKLLEKHPKTFIDFKYLPEDLAIRCAKLIGKLDELNPLHLTKNEEDMEFTNYYVNMDNGEDADAILNDYSNQYDLSDLRYGIYDLYNQLKRGAKGFSSMGITYNGFNKMMELLREYMLIHKDDDLEFKCDVKDLVFTLGDYIAFNRRMKFASEGVMHYSIKDFITEDNWKAIDLDDKMAMYLDNIEKLFNIRNSILSNKYEVADYIDISSKILKGQYRLPKELEEECKKCIKDIYDFGVELPKGNRIVDMKVSNAFFITPHNHLYHVSSHKFACIRDDYRLAMQEMNPTLEMLDCTYHFDNAKRIEKQGYITTNDFWFYFNLIYDCYFLKDATYESLDRKMQEDVKYLEGKVHDKTLVDFATGIECAKGSIWEFFYNLRLNANYYEMELFKIADMTFKDFLVRCCGFHKVESMVDKTITTSLVNYDEAFEEYIKRGWKIQFIPPIVLEDGSLVEYNKDFLTMRRVLKQDK